MTVALAEYWRCKRGGINKLLKELQTKPDEFKMGYSLCPGGILNAYREGDISFVGACDLLEVKKPHKSRGREWKKK